MRVILILVTVISLLTQVFAVQASQAPVLLITELMPNPVGSDTAGEWIELTYSGPEPTSLSNWYLNGAQLPEILIEPNSILILARDVSAIQLLVDDSIPVVGFSFSLNNSGGSLDLGGDTGVIQTFSYDQSHEGKSFELLSGDCDLIQESSSNTIGQQNSACESIPPVATTIPVPPMVFISAAMPNPSNGPEWIELVNRSDSQINLDVVTLKDKSGASMQLTGIISTNETKRIEVSGVSLNNSGDTLYLVFEGNVIDVFEYGTSKKGETIEVKATADTQLHEDIDTDIEERVIIKSTGTTPAPTQAGIQLSIPKYYPLAK